MAEKIRVLYVDDESTLLDLCKTYLERSGDFIVTILPSAPEAIRILELAGFDAIVSDYQMPEMDGIEFLNVIRARGDKTPFIIFTGKGREEVAIEALNSGADFYLQKGGEVKSQFAELSHKIRRAVSLRQAEVALRETERQFKEFFEQEPNYCYMVSPDGRILDLNRAAVAALGYSSKDELLGKPLVTTIYSPDSQEKAKHLFVTWKTTGKIQNEEMIIRTKAGEDRIVVLNASAVYAPDGTLRHSVSIQTDINDRRIAEEEVRITHEKYTKAFLSAPDAITISELDSGRFIEVNDAATRVFGYSHNELLGKTAVELGIWLNQEDRDHFIDQIRKHGKVSQLEILERRKSGELFYALVNADTISIGNVPYLVAIIRDITNRKNAEVAIRESEERYRALFDGINNGVAVYEVKDNGKDFIFKDFNRAGERIDHDQRERLLGKSLFAMRPGVEQFGLVKVLQRVWQTGKPESYPVALYTDKKLTGWYENYIYKLPSGEIVTVFDNVTNQKNAEAALRESEERYRAIVEDQTEFICRFTPDGKITFVNDAYCRYFSLDKDQCFNHPHQVVLPPEDAQLMKQHLASLTPQNPVATIEHRIIMPSGEVRWQRWNDRAIFDKDRHIVEYQSVGRDITEIKNAEKVLLEREAYYRTIFENTGTASVIVEDDTTISLANEEFANLCGYSREELEGKRHWTEFVVKEDLERMLDQHHLRRKDRKKAERHYEFRLVRKDGEVRNIYLSIDVIPGTKKSIASLLDITEYKKAEQALREREETHRLVLEFAGISSTLWTTDGHLLMINRYGAANLGGVPEDFLGKTMDELFGPEAGAVYLERIREVAATGTRMEFEDHVPLPEGDRWFLSSHTCLKDTTCQAKRVMIFSHDITQRKIAEQAHRDSTDQLVFAIEGAHLGLWDIDYTNRTINHNQYWNEMLGYGSEDSTRSIDWWRQFIHPDDLPVIDAASSDHQNGKTPVLDIVYRIRHQDGRWLWIHTIGKVVSRSTDGKPLRMSGINQDITELKQAEIATLDREEKFREIFNNVNDAIHLHEVGDDGFPGKFIDVNDVACRMMQYSRDEMLQHGPLDFATQYHSRPVDTIFEELRTVGQATFETGHRRKDGTILPVEVNAHKIVLQGRPVVLSVVRDITDRKKTEEALRESERQFRALSENSQDYIMRYDKEHRHTYANPACLRVSGMTKEQFIGKTHRELGFPPDLCTLWESAIDRVFTTGQPYGETFAWANREGNVILDWRLVPEKSDGGKVVSVLGVARDITAMKATEQALHESESWYRQFFTTSRDSVFITTPQGKFVDFNDVLLDLLGYRTREELIKVSIPDLYEDANVRKVFNALIIQNGYVEDYPVHLRKKDGTIIDTLITTVPLKADDGSVKAFFGTIRDVTEKKRADEEIRTLQQFQQSIIDNANVWISVLDPKGTILVWNTTAEQISGYSADDVIGKNTVWKQLYPDPMYRKQVVENILDIIHTNAYVENFETRIRTKGGDEKIIWWNTQPLRDASGKAVQFIAIGRDNTERKRSEERINALRQFEESVIKNANIWISVLDGKGNVSVWNNAAEEISGYKAAEVIGKNTIWSRMYPDKEYRRTVTAKIREVIGAHKYLENFETRIRTKDGQERIIWWNTRTLQDVTGIDETFIAIGKDVTEQKTLSDAVTLANKKLNLLSSITRHDIINQLSALNGYLELSRDILRDPVKLEEYIIKEQNIANTIETQIRFTKDYQDMGVKAPAWQNVHKTVDMSMSNLPLRGITVENGSPTLEVYADPLLVRVFYNLIDNALRYGGEQMTAIRISSQDSDGGLVIVCEDDGIGIPAGKKEAIFTRGYYKHTGFGLYLSREILGITDITITETGEPGKGARFEITVPKGRYRVGKKPE
ncbi:MAG: PAS domain S-box protein [Methanoregula sp.]|jgi:PAS domain S-box-containing protein